MAFRNNRNIFVDLDILGVKVTPIDILGVNFKVKVTPEELRKRYKALCLEYHPDKYTEEKGKKHCLEHFQEIQQAYATVSELISLNKASQVDTNDATHKRKHSCCEEKTNVASEQSSKRKRTAHTTQSDNFSTQTNGLFESSLKQRKIKYYFKDEWQVQFNYFFVDITSHELREAGLKLAVHRKSSDKITLMLPELKNTTLAAIKEKLNAVCMLDIQQEKIEIKNKSTTLQVNISGNNKQLFAKLLEIMIDQYQIQSDFSMSLRAIVNHAWWQDTLYQDDNMSQLNMENRH